MLPLRNGAALLHDSLSGEPHAPDFPRRVAHCATHGAYSLAVPECPRCLDLRLQAQRREEGKRLFAVSEEKRAFHAAAGRMGARARALRRKRAQAAARLAKLDAELAAAEATL